MESTPTPPSSSGSNHAEDDRTAVCGYSIHLPGDITTGEQLFEVIKAKEQMRRDVVAGKRYPGSIVDESEAGNPWKLKSRYCNMFTDEEGKHT